MYNVETGEVKIIDFGTSKIKSIVEQETTLPFYAPNFSAPEVVKGNSTTEDSDIYSLGAVIFYILFGMLPNGTEMICRSLRDLEVPEKLAAVIIKMVSALYSVDVRTINDHIKKVYSDSELEEVATIRKIRIVQTEGTRQVQRETNHYNLQMIIVLLYTMSEVFCLYEYNPLCIGQK